MNKITREQTMERIDALDAELWVLWVKLVNIHADSSLKFRRQSEKDDKHAWLNAVNGMRCLLLHSEPNVNAIERGVDAIKHKLKSLPGCG